MTPTLTPRLTPLDKRALAIVDAHAPVRARRVAELVHGIPARRCDTCGTVEVVSSLPAKRSAGVWLRREPLRCWARTPPDDEWCETGRTFPILVTTPEQDREVSEVLRGLERFGLVTQRSGWWRS